ncbi:MAG: GHMP kinase [Spirochaetia bacterium]|nr:GHMP kinase [Spirochaetia bacterium]
MSVIRTSAPGSLMITGEHAVLHGHTGSACAIDKRIYVELRPIDNRKIRINSQLGKLETDYDHIDRCSDFTFVLEAIREKGMGQGIELNIASEFSHKTGLGSSAAVTAAVCHALNGLAEAETSPMELFRQAFSIVYAVQHTGSGCDLAASVLGGIIRLQIHGTDRKVSRLKCPEFPEIDLYYCGYKMKTPEVIALVNRKAAEDPDHYRNLYSEMGAVADRTLEALEAGDMIRTGKYFDEYEKLMEKLGVCDNTLAAIIKALNDNANVYGAKISGSGLGDCVMSLGIPVPKPDYMNIPVKISDNGVASW